MYHRLSEGADSINSQGLQENWHVDIGKRKKHFPCSVKLRPHLDVSLTASIEIDVVIKDASLRMYDLNDLPCWIIHIAKLRWPIKDISVISFYDGF